MNHSIIRILVVDDEPAIRSILQVVLSSEGFTIRTAADAAEAMAFCSHEQFDLVLSDVVMPGMDGRDLTQWVALNYPTTQTALMSGFDIEGRGCALSPKLLAKPFTPRGAVGFVRSVLAANGA